MELRDLKEAVRELRVKASKELKSYPSVCNRVDGRFHDMLTFIQDTIEDEEREDRERYREEEPEPENSDFEEHNIWNHAQLGIE